MVLRPLEPGNAPEHRLRDITIALSGHELPPLVVSMNRWHTATWLLNLCLCMFMCHFWAFLSVSCIVWSGYTTFPPQQIYQTRMCMYHDKWCCLKNMMISERKLFSVSIFINFLTPRWQQWAIHPFQPAATIFSTLRKQFRCWWKIAGWKFHHECSTVDAFPFTRRIFSHASGRNCRNSKIDGFLNLLLQLKFISWCHVTSLSVPVCTCLFALIAVVSKTVEMFKMWLELSLAFPKPFHLRRFQQKWQLLHYSFECPACSKHLRH